MLAQDWLSNVNRVKCEYDKYLEAHLRLPEKFNPHSTPATLGNVAERIVFTDDVPSLLYEMRKNRQITYEGMFSSARLPFDCFWIEYKSVIGIDKEKQLTGIRYGALIVRNGSGARMLVVTGMTFEFMKEPLCAITHAIEFDHWPIKLHTSQADPNKKAIQFRVAWRIEDIERFDGKEHMLTIEAPGNDVLGNIMAELVFGVFLITQPKVYTEEAVEWDERKQKARAKAGAPPLLEYRRIKLHICKEAKRYTHSSTRPANALVDTPDTESEDAIRHRRYHKVMGHFRHYLHTSPPRTVWIEPHYRGDPSLGVTFTERDYIK